MTPKKFNQGANSIDAQLSKLPKSTRKKYKRNRAKFEADRRALEKWAADGHTTGSEDDG